MPGPRVNPTARALKQVLIELAEEASDDGGVALWRQLLRGASRQTNARKLQSGVGNLERMLDGSQELLLSSSLLMLKVMVVCRRGGRQGRQPAAGRRKELRDHSEIACKAERLAQVTRAAKGEHRRCASSGQQQQQWRRALVEIGEEQVGAKW